VSAARWLATLMVLFGWHGPAAAVRTLEVELEFQHIGGMLDPAELEAWLASPGLVIEAVYHPLKLIAGRTATRHATMPIGSRLAAILHTIELHDAQVERSGRTLRFRVDESPQLRDPYRLISLYLQLAVPPGLARPQPALKIGLLHEPAASGAHQVAVTGRFGAFDLGQRLRYRWSDAQGPAKRQPTSCGGDVREVDAERYRFRPHHRYAGLFEFLKPDVSSDPPRKPRPGWQSFRMRAPYPAPIDGWRVSRNHLIRLDVPGGRIDLLSIYAEQSGPGQCRRTRAYDALLAGDQFVRIERSLAEYDCDKDSRPKQDVRAEWLDDGSLARYFESSGAGQSTHDPFSIGQPAACGSLAPAPPPAQVDALTAEVQRMREAFPAQ
jgi:hypothetical protein